MSRQLPILPRPILPYPIFTLPIVAACPPLPLSQHVEKVYEVVTDKTTATTRFPKCIVKNCGKHGHPVPPFDTLEKCSNEDCTKFIHHVCYEYVIKSQHLVPIISQDGCELIVCGAKKCYNKQTKYVVKQQKEAAAMSDSGARIGWKEDGPLGTQDQLNSEKVVLDWLLTPGNYTKFCLGRKNDGIKKIQYAERIVAKIKEAGIRKERNAKDVLSKISHMEELFKKAHAWSKSETGANLEATDHATFKDIVLKKCPWYYEFLRLPGLAESCSARKRKRSSQEEVVQQDNVVDYEPTSVAVETPSESTQSAPSISPQESHSSNYQYVFNHATVPLYGEGDWERSLRLWLSDCKLPQSACDVLIELGAREAPDLGLLLEVFEEELKTRLKPLDIVKLRKAIASQHRLL